MFSLRTMLALSLTTVLTAGAATLEQLSMDALISRSTDIVRGKVLAAAGSAPSASGRGVIYTHYTVAVSERWKGPAASRIDVAVPGGSAQGLRQTFAGAPLLNAGDEYVFFLWTSRSGLTQIMGLTQGLMDVKVEASGKLVVNRAPASEPMIDSATRQPVTDTGVTMDLSSLKSRVLNTVKVAQ